MPGKSVNRVITSKDEWCAEAYMETDYSVLSENNFISVMKSYAAYLTKMNNFSNIKLFSVKELFPLIVNGKGNNNLLSDGDSTPYLGAKKDENGVMRYCAKDSALTLKGNCICFICNGAGSVGYTLYMDRPFIATSDIVAGYK